jgi:hypothetical protein
VAAAVETIPISEIARCPVLKRYACVTRPGSYAGAGSGVVVADWEKNFRVKHQEAQSLNVKSENRQSAKSKRNMLILNSRDYVAGLLAWEWYLPCGQRVSSTNDEWDKKSPGQMVPGCLFSYAWWN